MATQDLSPAESESEIAVALGLLRIGSDTLAPRLFRSIVSAPWTPRPNLQDEPPVPDRPTSRHLEKLAELLNLPRGVRHTAIGQARQQARTALASAVRGNLKSVGYADPSYPRLLWHIPDPPIAVWVRGNLAVLSRPAVAVVGSRDATPAGLAIARRIGREIAEAGLTVVSGLARGIDGAAHTGALEATGSTVAVLGCGADVVYPSGHRVLAAEIAASGAVVSELPPGTPPLPRHFPLRNRIISGLCRGVVVVEASERSGSLITARAALEQGRAVLAVPGGVMSGSHRGCHALIKDGARLVETVEDVLDELGWERQRGTELSQADKSLCDNDLDKLMAAGETYTLEDLVERSGRTVPQILAGLANLELAGKLTKVAGGGLVRLD